MVKKFPFERKGGKKKERKKQRLKLKDFRYSDYFEEGKCLLKKVLAVYLKQVYFCG